MFLGGHDESALVPPPKSSYHQSNMSGHPEHRNKADKYANIFSKKPGDKGYTAGEDVDDPYDPTPVSTKIMKAKIDEHIQKRAQEELQKMLKEDNKGHLRAPIHNINNRKGHYMKDPSQFGQSFGGGYTGEPTPATMARNPAEVHKKLLSHPMDIKAANSSVLLAKLYSDKLADAMSDHQSLYQPIASNKYQRLAYILKTRIRQNSLYGFN